MKELAKNLTKGGNHQKRVAKKVLHGQPREEDEEEEEEEEKEDEEVGEEDEEGGEDDENVVQYSGGLSWINDLRNIMTLWKRQLKGMEKQLGNMDLKIDEMKKNTMESESRIKDFCHCCSLQTQVLGSEK